MRKRNRQRTVAVEIPEELSGSPTEVGQWLLESKGFEDGIEAFWHWCQERKEWGDDNSVAMDPVDYERTGLPSGLSFFRDGTESLPRSLYQ